MSDSENSLSWTAGRYGLIRRLLSRGPKLLLIGYFLALGLFAWQVHPIEDFDISNPEMDNYCEKAVEIADGRFSRDAFHPALFPFLGAVVRPLFSSSFLACQAVSVLAGAAFVWISFLLGRQFGCRRKALFLAAMVALNGSIVIAGVRAASDMLFHFFALACVFLLSTFWKNRDEGSDRTWLLVGLLSGLAWSTRYLAVFLLPVIFITLGWATSHGRARRFGCLLIGGLLAMSPQMAINFSHFGNPVYNENWRNVVAYYTTMQEGGISGRVDAVSVEDRSRVLSDVVRRPLFYLSFVATQLDAYLRRQGPMDLGGSVSCGWVLGGLFLGSAIVSILFRRREHVFLCVTAAIQFLGIGLTFPPAARLLLILVPIVWGVILANLKELLPRPGLRWGILSLLAVWSFAGSCHQLVVFSNSHCREDILSGQAIAQNHPTAAVLGTSPFLHHHFDFQYMKIPVPKSSEYHLQFMCLALKNLLLHRPDFVIVSATGSYGLPTPDILFSAPNTVFPFLIPLRKIGNSRSFLVEKRHPFFRQRLASSTRETMGFRVVDLGNGALSWDSFLFDGASATKR